VIRLETVPGFLGGLAFLFQISLTALAATHDPVVPSSFNGVQDETFTISGKPQNGTIRVITGDLERPEDRRSLKLIIEELRSGEVPIDETITLFPEEDPDAESQVRSVFSQIRHSPEAPEIRRMPRGLTGRLKQWLPGIFSSPARNRIGYALFVFAIEGAIWARLVASPHVSGAVMAQAAMAMGMVSAMITLINPHYRRYLEKVGSWGRWAIWEVCFISFGVALIEYHLGLPYDSSGLPHHPGLSSMIKEVLELFAVNASTEGIWEISLAHRGKRRREGVTRNRPLETLTEEEIQAVRRIEGETDEDMLVVYGMGAGIMAGRMMMHVDPVLLYPAILAIFAGGVHHYRHSVTKPVGELDCGETILMRGLSSFLSIK
jgi:hypothetical protein